MNVKELINVLSKLPNQEQLILVDGYETGYDDVHEIEEIEVKRHPSPASYDGEWTYTRIEDTDKVKAYLLPRC